MGPKAQLASVSLSREHILIDRDALECPQSSSVLLWSSPAGQGMASGCCWSVMTHTWYWDIC